jgi:hypothetical protein
LAQNDDFEERKNELNEERRGVFYVRVSRQKKDRPGRFRENGEEAVPAYPEEPLAVPARAAGIAYYILFKYVRCGGFSLRLRNTAPRLDFSAVRGSALIISRNSLQTRFLYAFPQHVYDRL